MIYVYTFLQFLVLYGIVNSLCELNRKYNYLINIHFSPELRFIFFGFLYCTIF